MAIPVHLRPTTEPVICPKCRAELLVATDPDGKPLTYVCANLIAKDGDLFVCGFSKLLNEAPTDAPSGV